MSHGLTIYRDVKCDNEQLHNKNYVFADLRPPNILIFGTGEELHTNLIDFDWCGRHDVDSYPSSMNEDIQWPQGQNHVPYSKKLMIVIGLMCCANFLGMFSSSHLIFCA